MCHSWTSSTWFWICFFFFFGGGCDGSKSNFNECLLFKFFEGTNPCYWFWQDSVEPFFFNFAKLGLLGLVLVCLYVCVYFFYSKRYPTTLYTHRYKHRQRAIIFPESLMLTHVFQWCALETSRKFFSYMMFLIVPVYIREFRRDIGTNISVQSLIQHGCALCCFLSLENFQFRLWSSPVK